MYSDNHHRRKMFTSTSMPTMMSSFSTTHRSRAALTKHVQSSHGTPRLSCSSDPPQLVLKQSERVIDFSTRSTMHRLSADERDIRRYARRTSQTRLNFDRESPNCTRRASRAADMFSETGDFGITLAEQLQLSSYQIQCLQQTWSKLRTSPNFLYNVFRAVVANNAMAKELFQKASIIEGFSSASGKCCTIKEHARTLCELIDFCIHEIHSSTKVAHDRCMSIGEMHCGASDRSMGQVWDQFGDSLAEAVTKAEPVRGKRECLKAWNALVSFIVDSTKGGYLAEYKRQKAKKWSRQENSAAHCA